MSLPPGFIDELRGRLSLGQVVGRKVMWDNRKSNQGKGDLWAPCPFHQEKTASFHVDDRKGFYYCFGCHAKGDAFNFVQETENVSFMEAVEILAREAGMPVPRRDPEAQQKADRRTRLSDVMEQAVQHYRLQLRTAQAGSARDYLDGRGLDAAALERWEIGFAPDQRQGVLSALKAKGIDEALIVEAGLAARPDDGGPAYDRFRGRIIFPIRDSRGRAIALGGRAMDANARAKYLNSPETPLFDKGRSLYNHGPAREASGKNGPLVVAEGYMDTIALVEAGFAATVAPLGTAITAEQLQLMWRMSPEPVIALDGDTAGLRAAMRLIDLALPLLEAGRSLRFAIMPAGLDPDDVLRAQGAGAMRRIIEGAVPLVQLLWRRETEGKVFDSPERKAALDKALRDAIRVIPDPSLKSHYGQELKDLRWELFGKGRSTLRRGGRGDWRRDPPPHPTAGTRASALAVGGAAEDRLREGVILAVLLRNPGLIDEFEAEIERMDCHDPDHATLRSAILRRSGAGELEAAVEDELGAEMVARLFAQPHIAVVPAVRRTGDASNARLCLAEELAKLSARRGHAREIEDAIEDVAGVVDEGLTWRLRKAAESVDRAGRGDNEDRAEYDTGDNGARMRRDERNALDNLLGSINFAKRGS
ncbi:DNA primase [Ponticoccus sp. SC2-23]|uniref:DNA primase n=1 Tax=Alexandriicola marinus TaxID=2081710 RepID=UPI000FDC9492|nr:DNA primase [Alexandriicola marinus]MBM1221163.1 DNA primase [Ponticoccus sp. SC6-9]MBM1225733.1 DNA primase [Ponticoccus sp. SC6-15]MBM1227885.1 DNA primase [Ponticoccus sp. SC6-38]MBM1234477.1 DNA primase [Ponticoccus sp. SC6-45]MBM1238387.1 DNA primase [Ponticoccus sp. SC6-49]MBM1243656.1 DNA primase [Ponticoccus sp. SC2-64]MBM1248001.1 DNA primase [Ponticoccus sp. SC6-42]MBM1252787.1 DNA primase [Ponticoccus sp. SC6-33]MBM1256396.1 DNA primase [Ponticoccus sp. SC6-60]MBM1261681.1 D